MKSSEIQWNPVKSSEIQWNPVKSPFWIPQESPGKTLRNPPDGPACWDAPNAAPGVAGSQLRLHGARSLTWPSPWNCCIYSVNNDVLYTYYILIYIYTYIHICIYIYICIYVYWVRLVIAVSCAIVVCKWNCCGEFVITIWMFFPCDWQKSKWRVCVDLWYYGSFAPMNALL